MRFKSFIPPFFLFLFSFLYCHRFYGTGLFHLEGDAAWWPYIRLNERLLWGEHLPHGYYYSSLFNWAGLFNPPVLLLSALMHLIFSSDQEVARAVITCMVLVVLSTTFLSLSIYLFLRWLQRSVIASLLGAIVVTYTGFHLVAIREFSVMYQQSFMMVPLLLYCCWKILENKKPLIHTAGIALAIGFSLMAGTNVPLFYYVPLCFFFPLVIRKFPLSYYRYLTLACLLGLLIGSVTILPGIFSLWDSNRVDVDFVNIMHSTSPLTKLTTAFLRDWWAPSHGTYHEQDGFLGLPVIFLFLSGILSWKKVPLLQRRSFALLLLWSILVMHHSFLPDPFFSGIRKLYNLFSFRNSNRFFMLALLPIAYFVALGFDTRSKTRSLVLCIGLILLQQLLIYWQLLPRLQFLLPDTKLAANAGLTLGVLLTLLLCFQKLNRLAPVFLFALYFISPIQFTHYPIPYINDPTLIGKIDSNRLSLRTLLGMRWEYGKTIEGMRELLTEHPHSMSRIPPLSGRIWDRNKNVYHFAGSRTNHEFFFLLPEHHTTSKQISEYYRARTDAMLDMAGICWVLPENNHLAIRRPNCFPKAWGIHSIIKASDELTALDWLRSHSTDTFRTTAVTTCQNCQNFDGSTLPIIRSMIEEPGHLEFFAEAPEGGYLVLTVPYHPEWRAEILGKTIKPIRVNHAFMAFPLIQGKYSVRLYLTHFYQKLGLFVSAMALLITLFPIWDVILIQLSSRRARMATALTET